MTKSKKDIEEFSEKIARGLDLTWKKLLAKKKAENGTFVFWEDGKIVHVKAVDIKE